MSEYFYGVDLTLDNSIHYGTGHSPTAGGSSPPNSAPYSDLMEKYLQDEPTAPRSLPKKDHNRAIQPPAPPTRPMKGPRARGQAETNPILPVSALVPHPSTNNFDYGFDALGIPIEQFRDVKPSANGSTALPREGNPITPNPPSSSSFSRKSDSFLPPIASARGQGGPLARTEALTSTILSRQLPSQQYSLESSTSDLFATSHLDEVSDSSLRYGWATHSSSSSTGNGKSNNDDCEEIPLVTSMDKMAPGSPEKVLSIVGRLSSYGMVHASPGKDDETDFIYDLYRPTQYPPAYDTVSLRSGSAKNSVHSMYSPSPKKNGPSKPPGVTRWVGPPPKGSLTEIIGDVSGGQFAKEADIDAWETCDTVAVVEHKGPQPSKNAAVTNRNRRIVVSKGRFEGGCDVDECLFRQRGCTVLPLVLLEESQKRFCRNGENVFTVFIDRSESGKITNVPVTPALEIGCGVVKQCTLYANEFKDVETELKLSLTYYIEGGDYLDLISGSSKDEGVQPLEVATSPIFGQCIDNCQWLLLEKEEDFKSLVKSVEERVDPKWEGVLMVQFLFQACLPAPVGTRSKVGDVILSSFTIACTSSVRTYESILDQRPNTNWRLFKYALCKGPCIVTACVCVDESDTDAAHPLSVLQRMKSIPHPRPLRGSMADYITKQREEVANLEWRKGFAKGDSKRFDVLLRKAKTSIDDAVAFIKDPQKVHVPLYIDSKRRGSSYLLGKATDFLKYRKIKGRAPQTLALITTTPKKKQHKGTVHYDSDRVIVDNNEIKVLTGNSNQTELSYKLSEITAAPGTSATTLSKLHDLTLDGFSTSVFFVTPKDNKNQTERTSLLNSGISALIENAMSLVKKALHTLSDKRSHSDTRSTHFFLTFAWVDKEATDFLGSKNKNKVPLSMGMNPFLQWFPKGVSKVKVTDLQGFNQKVQEGQKCLIGSLGNRKLYAEEGFLLLTVEVHQVAKSEPKGTKAIVSSMTSILLGDNYDALKRVVTQDSSIHYDTTVSSPTVLLSTYLLGPFVSVCAVLLNPEEPSLDVRDLLGVVVKTTTVKSQQVPHGCPENIIECLRRAKEKLKQPSGSPPPQAEVTLSMLDEMVHAVTTSGALASSQYYNRWPSDLVTLERCGFFSPSGTQQEGNDEEKEGNDDTTSVESTTHTKYYGIDYSTDPIRMVRSKPQSPPVVVVVNRKETYPVIVSTSSTSVEVCYKGNTNKQINASDVVELRSDSQGLKSKSLAFAVSCVVSGRSAALVAFDTEPTEDNTSVSWLTLRTSINRLFVSLSSRPSLISARVVLIVGDIVLDLLSGVSPSEVKSAKYSPFCGPTFYDAVGILVQSAEEVDSLLSVAVASTEALRKQSNGDVVGSIAVQLTVHQVVKRTGFSQRWTKGWPVDHAYLRTLVKDYDVLVSSLWCVCNGPSTTEWLVSSPPSSLSQPKTLPFELRQFLFGGPCYTTVVMGLSTFDKKRSSNELVKIRQMSDVVDKLTQTPLREPRFGSLVLYEKYLEALLQHRTPGKTTGEEGTARLNALLMEVRVVLQRCPGAVSAQLDKPLSCLAHDPKYFAAFEKI